MSSNPFEDLVSPAKKETTSVSANTNPFADILTPVEKHQQET